MKVVVIGGGVVGEFVSYYARKTGHDVTLVDICPECGRTSKTSAGFIVQASAPEPPISMLRILRTSLGGSGPIYVSTTEMLRNQGWMRGALKKQSSECERKLIAFAGKSLELYRTFLRDEKVKVDSIRKLTELFVDNSTAKEAAAEMNGRYLNQEEVNALGYMNFGGGAEFVDELSVNPGKLCDELRKLLLEAGVNCISGEAELSRNDGTCSVSINKEPMPADQIVIAAGAWSSGLCRQVGYDPQILPARGLASIFDTGGARVLEAPAILEDYGVAIVQHDQNTLRATGFFDLVGFDQKYTDRRRRWVMQVLERHVRRFKELKLAESRVGHRPCTPDRLPVVGRVPNCRNLYISSGHCRIGITLAAASGYAISSMLENREVDLDLTCFDPSRFE
jgi:D-amino-acid dehydrogenase